MEIWGKVLNKLEKQLAKPSFETWLANTNAIVEDDEYVIVTAKNSFQRDWLESRYKTDIFDAIWEITGKTYEISIRSEDSKEDMFPPSQTVMDRFQKLEQLVESFVGNFDERVLSVINKVKDNYPLPQVSTVSGQEFTPLLEPQKINYESWEKYKHGEHKWEVLDGMDWGNTVEREKLLLLLLYNTGLEATFKMLPSESKKIFRNLLESEKSIDVTMIEVNETKNK
jgi:hypothetical protein